MHLDQLPSLTEAAKTVEGLALAAKLENGCQHAWEHGYTPQDGPWPGTWGPPERKRPPKQPRSPRSTSSGRQSQQACGMGAKGKCKVHVG
eukprot:2029032-Lingulodinium_polyedra.AAC.1